MTFEGDGCPPVTDGHRSKMRRFAKIAVPTTAALGAGAMIASAAIPAADGTINACYNTSTAGGSKGSVRVVDSSADCFQSEAAIAWNQKGPAGPQGSQGPAGANGVNGQNGGAGGAVGGAVFPRAATDYLLEIDGIKGESSDAKHPGTIDIESFSWGAVYKSSGPSKAGSEGGAGKVSFHDISIKKPVDVASPKLFLACATGQHLKKAVLYVRKAGGGQVEYLKITLTDVLVSSYHVGSQEPKGPGEVESLSLNFTKMEEQYVPVSPNGSPGPPVKAGFDTKANKPA